MDHKPQEPVMGQAKEKALYKNPTDYEDDYYRWGFEQAEFLQQKRFAELDIPNLIEEIEDMSKRTRHALESSYRLVMLHLLKWAYQSSHRTTFWKVTLVRERGNIEELEEDNPSLAEDMPRNVYRPYRRARREASIETGLPIETFPAECPFTLAQLRDDEFLPD